MQTKLIIKPPAAAILVGGRSRRMGQDKALLVPPNGAECLLDRQLAKLLRLGVEELYLVGRPDQRASHVREGTAWLDDVWDDSGPLAGMLTAFEQVTTESCLILGVDLPLLGEPALASVLHSPTPLVYTREGRFEPLCGLYRKAYANELRRRLEVGERRLQSFVAWAKEYGGLLSPELPEQWRRDFANWNRQEDISVG
jgi:molybdenum cofactor guanylyltransferase